MHEKILHFLSPYHPVLMALMAATVAWSVTASGAALVFFTKRFNQRVMDGMLGAAAGIMLAASYWSLLGPSIELSRGGPLPAWAPALIGFLTGGAVLYGIDKILPHLHPGLDTSQAEGIKTSWQRSVLLVLAITLHNIPEGMAIGVAFGALGAHPDYANPATTSLALGAVALAIGIALQDFPEGLAVSMPLRREGMGRFKAFMCGQASGLVEPAAAVLSAWAVLSVQSILPYALAFAGGAMIFVTVEELIPESQQKGNSDLATMGTIGGFALMMVLDVAFA